MGSKDKICDELMKVLPNAENFYDLFGGGFSVTHAAILHKKYSHYHFNEITGGPCEIVKKAMNGEFNYKNFKPKFVSREEFFLNKDKDPYTRIIWSFGNNQKDYLFSKEIEPYKRALHNAVIFDEFNDAAIQALGFEKWPANMKHPTNKRLLARQTIVKRNKGMKRGDLHRLEQLERLQQLQRLQQLEQLQRLVEFSSVDYRQVKIKENSIVYCDPPYIGTCGYLNDFNHKEFYQWAREAKFCVFISEYTMPDDFKKIASLSVRSRLSAKDNVKATENVYVNKYAHEVYFK